jgi:hypothetical protein
MLCYNLAAARVLVALGSDGVKNLDDIEVVDLENPGANVLKLFCPKFSYWARAFAPGKLVYQTL